VRSLSAPKCYMPDWLRRDTRAPCAPRAAQHNKVVNKTDGNKTNPPILTFAPL
jgi:hypothetical protein